MIILILLAYFLQFTSIVRESIRTRIAVEIYLPRR